MCACVGVHGALSGGLPGKASGSSRLREETPGMNYARTTDNFSLPCPVDHQ